MTVPYAVPWNGQSSDLTLPDPPQSVFDPTYDWYKTKWSELSPEHQEFVRQLFRYNVATGEMDSRHLAALFNPYVPLRMWTVQELEIDPAIGQVRSLEQVPRPEDLADPAMSEFENGTYRVEFERPAGPFELSTEAVKLRGWYIQGKANRKALVVFYGGRQGEAFTRFEGTGTREFSGAIAARGYDVLLVDKRGCGVSGGTCNADAMAMAEDVFGMLKQLETGDGLQVFRPHQKEPASKIRLLPGPPRRNTPVFLLGESYGSAVAQLVMIKHTLAKRSDAASGLSFHQYFGSSADYAGALDHFAAYRGQQLAFPGIDFLNQAFYADFDIRGGAFFDEAGLLHNTEAVLDGTAFAKIYTLYFLLGQLLSESPNAITVFKNPVRTLPAGLIAVPDGRGLLETVAEWPSYFAVKGTLDGLYVPQSSVDLYNTATRLKDLVIFEGPHGGLAPYMSEIRDRFFQILDQAMENESVSNTRTMTIDEAVEGALVLVP